MNYPLLIGFTLVIVFSCLLFYHLKRPPANRVLRYVLRFDIIVGILVGLYLAFNAIGFFVRVPEM
jgi:hypothetical protein